MFLSPRWTKEKYDDFYINEYEKYYPRSGDLNERTSRVPELIAERLTEFGYSNDGGKILDIGSGFGDALLYLKRKYYPDASYHAIEPSRVCVDFLQKNNISIVSETVDSNWHKTDKYELIIMRHVLEHFLDPTATLQKVAEALDENGIAYIAVPDAYHPISPLNEYYFRAVHVSYFNRDTIASFLNTAGLEAIQLTDDLNGELFVIARKSKESIQQQIANVYDKQSQILKAVYVKEKKTAPKQNVVSMKSLLKKVIRKFVSVNK